MEGRPWTLAPAEQTQGTPDIASTGVEQIEKSCAARFSLSLFFVLVVECSEL